MRTRLIFAALALLGLSFGTLIGTAGSASATTPVPTTTTTVTHGADGSSSVTVVSQIVQKDSVHWKGTLAAWWSVKLTHKQKRHVLNGTCIWSDGKNYYSTVDTKHGWHPDHHMHLCRTKKSPTGWIKVGGGQSGSHCMNVASPGVQRALPNVPRIRGPITEVRSFGRFFSHAKAHSFDVLDVSWVCEGGTIHVQVGADGYVEAKTLQKLFFHTKGTFTSFQQSLKGALAASALSSSTASAAITCSGEGKPIPPPSSKSIVITSMTQLNKVDAGRSSGPYSIEVNASDAGGSVVVDPGIGSVSSCDDTAGANKQGSMTFSNLGSGDSSLCVLIWAPNDADKPASMTVTVTAILGTAKDVKSQTVPIGYPTRP